MPDLTLDYYDQNAAAFVGRTVETDLTCLYAPFLALLQPGASILDLGCGSGRDSKHFLEHGYAVEAVDGSPALCKIASAHIGRPVRQLLFQDLDDVEAFDAVWANASLLHMPKEALPGIFQKISDALKPGGIFHASFRHGSFSGERDGRLFTDLTERDLIEIVEHTPEFQIVSTSVTQDARPDRSDVQWLNTILQKRL